MTNTSSHNLKTTEEYYNPDEILSNIPLKQLEGTGGRSSWRFIHKMFSWGLAWLKNGSNKDI